MGQGRLQGKVAVITGGARGIGKATAVKMVEEGASVALLDTLSAELEKSAGELTAGGGRALGIKADVTRRPEIEKAVEKTAAEFGGIHILVNNAGIVKPALLQDVTEADWDKVVEVNLKGALFCTQAVLPYMKKAHYGKIVNISSRASLGKEIRTAYSATKSGLIGMTRTWALELGGDNINVNAIGPGPIATELFTNANPADSPRTRAIIEGVPLKRIGRPEDIANAAVFLSTEESSFITGQILFVCGGLTVGLAHY